MTRDGLRLFYIPPAAVQGERVILGAEESAHIRRVLKMKVGAICRAATSEGQEYKIELTEITASESTARIIERLPKRPSSPLSIALGLPLLKGERFEWVLQKGCELGADAFYPLMPRAVRSQDTGKKEHRAPQALAANCPGSRQAVRSRAPACCSSTR